MSGNPHLGITEFHTLEQMEKPLLKEKYKEIVGKSAGNRTVDTMIKQILSAQGLNNMIDKLFFAKSMPKSKRFLYEKSIDPDFVDDLTKHKPEKLKDIESAISDDTKAGTYRINNLIT